MTAVAKRESNPDAFVGQVLARSSPILTWRPALVANTTNGATDAAHEISAYEVLEGRESSVHRISRAPTRRMVAWPVIQHVHRTHTQSAWTIARRVALAIVAISALVAAGVAAHAWDSRGVARVSAPVAKVVAAHVVDPGFDALVPPPAPALAASQAASPSPAAVQAAPKPAPAKTIAAPAPLATQRGRAHHGHRHAPSATR